MRPLDYIILIIVFIIISTLIDRWFFRKIIIKDRSKIDSEKYLIKSKSIFYFGLIRTNTEFVEYDGKFYMKLREDEVSTHETEPRFIKKAMLKYKLEN